MLATPSSDLTSSFRCRSSLALTPLIYLSIFNSVVSSILFSFFHRTHDSAPCNDNCLMTVSEIFIFTFLGMRLSYVIPLKSFHFITPLWSLPWPPLYCLQSHSGLGRGTRANLFDLDASPMPCLCWLSEYCLPYLVAIQATPLQYVRLSCHNQIFGKKAVPKEHHIWNPANWCLIWRQTRRDSALVFGIGLLQSQISRWFQPLFSLLSWRRCW